MKKQIFVLLAVCLTACMVLCVSAETAEDLAWSIDENGVLTITGNGAMPDYMEYWDYAPWYNDRSSIKSIVIGEGITHIGELAFYNCQDYDSVTIPASVTSVGDGAFKYCQSFTTINVAEDNPAFKVVDGILFSKDGTTIVKCPEGMMNFAYTVPDGVTHIGTGAFENCWNMPSVTIPESVVSFGDRAFALCSKLVSANIPSKITEIPDHCFAMCGVLESIEIPSGVTSIDAEAFEACWALAEITLPEELVSIGDSAFAYCKGISEIVIPAKVETIGEGAFRVCVKLPEITVAEANTSFTTADGVLFSADMTTLVCYPSGKEGAAYTIPATVDNVYGFAFSENTVLTEIILSPETVTIGNHAFYKCNITSVIIPEKTKEVGYRAFGNCANLAKATVYSKDAEYKYEGNAFYGSAEGFTVECYKDSTAEACAIANGYNVEYLTVQGDIDGDGETTVKDVITVLSNVLNGIEADGADLNGDGNINLLDVLCVLKLVVK